MTIRSAVMRTRSAIGVLTALVACAGHGQPDDPEACRDPALDPAVFGRLHGDWTVAHAEFVRGQKPPTKRVIGHMTLSKCRYRFVASPDVDLADARDDLPVIDAREGIVEFAPPHRSSLEGHHRALAALRLHTGPRDGEDPSIWAVDALERVQEGEYLYFAPVSEVDVLRWEVYRGKWQRQPGEYISGSNPVDPMPAELRRYHESR